MAKTKRYIGGIKHLMGKTALVKPDTVESFFKGNSPFVMAQFDDLDAEVDGVSLAYGWHQFEAASFEEIEDGKN